MTTLKKSLLDLLALKKTDTKIQESIFSDESGGFQTFKDFNQKNLLRIMKIRDQKRKVQNLLNNQKKLDEQDRNALDVDNLQL